MIDVEVKEAVENLSIEVEDFVETKSEGTTDYELLSNKPAIDSVELFKGTKLSDIGIETVTNSEINDLFK